MPLEWFRWLSEPQRVKPTRTSEKQAPLGLNYVSFSIAGVETGDVANFSVYNAIPHNRAKVTVIEIVPPSDVGITEIGPVRYS